MKKILLGLAVGLSCMGLMACTGSSAEPTTSASATAAAETSKEAAAAAETSSETAMESVQAGEGLVMSTPGKLVMATNAEFPPYEYREGSEIVGIDVDMAKEIAARMGLELMIEEMNFDSIIAHVSSGKSDVGIAGMTMTEDRLKNIDFSVPYTAANQVVIVKEDSAIVHPDDLTGKIIGVQQGTVGDIFASDIEGASVERYLKGFEAVLALTQGKVDAVIIDNEPAKVFVSETAGIKILDEAYAVEEYAIAIKKGNTALTETINAIISEMQNDGTMDAIVEKYIKAE